MDWAVAEFEKQHGAGRANKLKSNARAIRRLRTACENAKRAVSSAPSCTLEVSSTPLLFSLGQVIAWDAAMHNKVKVDLQEKRLQCFLDSSDAVRGIFSKTMSW